VDGSKDLVRAAYLQNAGIGRGMKVGKEGIVGAMAALEAWAGRDHVGEQAEQRRAVELWGQALACAEGLKIELVDDPTSNQIQRLGVDCAGFRTSAAAVFAAHLATEEPAVIMRDEFLDRNRFELDPCNLHPGEAETVGEKFAATAAALSRTPVNQPSLTQMRRAALERRLAWPD
jgi:L-seryl-tRNA(Ser) seleniumtransferase